MPVPRTSHLAAVATQMTMTALESALPPLRVAAKCLQFKRSPPSSDARADDVGGDWKLMADIKQGGEISSTVTSIDKHVTAQMWSMVTTLRENVGDADKMQQACSDLEKMIQMNGTLTSMTIDSKQLFSEWQARMRCWLARPAPSMQWWRP